MAFPFMPLALLASSLLASRRSGQRADPSQLFAQLFQQQLGLLGPQLQPALLAMQQAASTRGMALGQNLTGALGAIGGLNTGAGRVAASLGQSAASSLRTEAEGNFRAQLAQLAQSGALGLLGPQQGFAESQRSGGENFLDFLARGLSGGQFGNILMPLLQQTQQRKAPQQSSFFAPSFTNPAPGGFGG